MQQFRQLPGTKRPTYNRYDPRIDRSSQIGEIIEYL